MTVKFYLFIGTLLINQAYSEAFIETSTENYSQAFRIYDLIQDKPQTIKQGKYLYSHSRFETGMRFMQHFSIAYLMRFDAVLKHSQDAGLIYYNTHRNDQALDERHYHYHYHVNINAFSAIGASVAFFQTIQAFSYRVSLDILSTQNPTTGKLFGQLSYQDDILSGDATLDYAYKRDALFKRDVDPPSGFGLGVNVDVSMQSSLGEHKLQVKDLFLTVMWSKIPYTKAVLNTNKIAGRDETGKLVIRPFGEGKEGYKLLRQRLPARWYLSNEFNVAGHWLIANINYLADRVWPQVGYQWRLKNQRFSLTYSIVDQSMGFSYQLHNRLKYYLSIDNINYKKVHRFNTGLSLAL